MEVGGDCHGADGEQVDEMAGGAFEGGKRRGARDVADMLAHPGVAAAGDTERRLELAADGEEIGAIVGQRKRQRRVAARAAEGEERIEVADGAGADVFLRHRGEGEIEEDDLEGVIAAHPADGDVVGLDVAVGDPLLLEVADDVDEVFAEALEELDVEAALLANPAGEGLDPLVVGVGEDWPHEEAGMVADRHLLHEGHDPRVAVLRQGAKRGRFGAEPLGMLGKESDFEDQLLAGGVAPREGAGDEERR